MKDKLKKTYICWDSKPKNVKKDFEMAVVDVINIVFSETSIRLFIQFQSVSGCGGKYKKLAWIKSTKKMKK